jgi:ferredoxin-type protein NapH
MNTIQSAMQHVRPGDAHVQQGFVRTLLLMLPMFLLTAMMTGRGGIPSDPIRFAAWGVTLAFLNTLFFLMLRNRKTDRYRSILFIAMAATFVISFISNLLEARGSMMFTESDMIEGDIPFCHLVIPMTLIPAALTKTINFPGTILGSHAIAPMFILWSGVSLALGGDSAVGSVFSGVSMRGFPGS